MNASIRIIYASTSGHTEFVAETLVAHLLKKNPQLQINKQRVETAAIADLTKDDLLILASGTWNTGGVEGQLNPYMHAFLKKDAKGVDLKKRKCAIIALGDERYFYTARANEHLATFIHHHNGAQLLPPLTVVNEPFGQEKKIQHWGDELLRHLKGVSAPSAIE